MQTNSFFMNSGLKAKRNLCLKCEDEVEFLFYIFLI